jgi:DNA-binding SARP family transcriptional activator
LRVWDGAAWSAIRAGQQRAVLAVLLAADGRAVSMDRLVDEIWGEHPPSSARSTVQGYVMRLRRLLGDRDGEVLVTRGPGYELVTGDDDVDYRVFERLVAAGRRSLAERQLETAARQLTEALALWRGPAMADVPMGPTVAAEVTRLGQSRLTALEERLGAVLELGGHADVVDELTQLVQEHPLRERMRGQLMLALYRCGRRAEALDAYRRGRRVLVAELGLEPGPQLRELEQLILADDRTLAAPGRGTGVQASPPVVPAQLPADSAGFTGRETQLRQLDALLPAREDRDRGPAVLVISAITGAGGVGKTALAVRWARRMADRFPDGQLYVNLRGYAADPPLRPAEALARFLRALDVPAEKVPLDEDEAASLYRSCLVGKRMLVLLDDACHPDQVRPLLPGWPGCLVLVTSRDQLVGLTARDGAVRLSLDVLTPAEAEELLAAVLGPDRVRAEPGPVAELARLCGYLPLALRIAAANLTALPRRPVADYVALLRADRWRALEVGGDRHAAVRATFDLSYQALPAEARRLFRLLGLAPGPDVTVAAAAALGGMSPAAAGTLLSQVAGAHLIGEHAPGRYDCHDLIRLYATEQARGEDTEPERHAALERLLLFYLRAVDAAARLLYPDKLRLPLPDSGPAPGEPATAGFGDVAAASAWLEAERPNLVAAVHHAAAHGPRSVGWQLADALRGYFHLRREAADWLAVGQAGLSCAQADDHPAAQAAAHLSLALLHWNHSRHAQATHDYTQALALARRAGWPDGEAAALGNLGNVYQEMGQLQRAADNYQDALVLARRTNWRFGEANGLNSIGDVYYALGRLSDARDTLDQALTLHREVGSRSGEADVLRVLSAIHRECGRHSEALDHARSALTLARTIGDRRYEADAHNALAAVQQCLGRYREALDGHTRALGLARQIGSRYPETEALIGSAAASRACGDLDAAARHAEAAATIAGESGYRMLEGLARTARASVYRDQGLLETALDEADRALAIHAETGHRVGAADAHLVAADALRGLGRLAPAETHRDAARAVFAATGARRDQELAR